MNLSNEFIGFLKLNYIPGIVTVGLLIAYFIGRSIIFRLIKLQAVKNHIAPERALFIRKLIHIILILMLFILLGTTWEISLHGLSIYFASIFTILGVALFANWSLLSNMTASIILFFFFPFRIGHTVRIGESDTSQTGKIVDISLFYMKIETLDKSNIVVIPNNVVLQRIMIQIV